MEGNPLENPRIQSDFCRIFYREFNFFRDKEVVYFCDGLWYQKCIFKLWYSWINILAQCWVDHLFSSFSFLCMSYKFIDGTYFSPVTFKTQKVESCWMMSTAPLYSSSTACKDLLPNTANTLRKLLAKGDATCYFKHWKSL